MYPYAFYHEEGVPISTLFGLQQTENLLTGVFSIIRYLDFRNRYIKGDRAQDRYSVLCLEMCTGAGCLFTKIKSKMFIDNIDMAIRRK